MSTRRPVTLIIFVLSLTVVLITALAGCGGESTPSTVETSTASSASPDAGGNTIKLGYVDSLQGVVGLDGQRSVQAVVEYLNGQGGVDIGGKKYQIQVVSIDTNSDNDTARAGVQKLISEGVKFILGDDTVSGWVQLTEENKILSVISGSAPAALDPQNKYTVQGTFINTGSGVAWGWLSENNPDVKSAAGMYPDYMIGHQEASKLETFTKAFGQTLLGTSFFPIEQSDLSALATKAASLKPDVFTTGGSGINVLAGVFKALRDAGYEGQLWLPITSSTTQILKVMTPEQTEGMYITEDPTEFEQPPVATKELMDAYAAKYGKWDSPTIFEINSFYCWLAAIQKAQSLEVDKVAAVLGNGLEFEAPSGKARMVSRPDLGGDRTVDAVYTTYIARVESGKAHSLDTIDPDEALQYLKKLFGW